MEMSSLKNYFGVPVLVQLRFPLAGIQVTEKGKLPYAAEPDKSQWMPGAMMEGGSPSGTQLIQFAVLREIQEIGTTIEMLWASIPSAPAPGSIIASVATIATLIDAKDIVAVTRVVSMPDSSPLIFSGR